MCNTKFWLVVSRVIKLATAPTPAIKCHSYKLDLTQASWYSCIQLECGSTWINTQTTVRQINNGLFILHKKTTLKRDPHNNYTYCAKRSWAIIAPHVSRWSATHINQLTPIIFNYVTDLTFRDFSWAGDNIESRPFRTSHQHQVSTGNTGFCTKCRLVDIVQSAVCVWSLLPSQLNPLSNSCVTVAWPGALVIIAHTLPSSPRCLMAPRQGPSPVRQRYLPAAIRRINRSHSAANVSEPTGLGTRSPPGAVRGHSRPVGRRGRPPAPCRARRLRRLHERTARSRTPGPHECRTRQHLGTDPTRFTSAALWSWLLPHSVRPTRR